MLEVDRIEAYRGPVQVLRGASTADATYLGDTVKLIARPASFWRRGFREVPR